MNQQNQDLMSQLFALDMLNPSLESVMDYLNAAHEQKRLAGETEIMPIEFFFKPEDLQFWADAYAKRPKDVNFPPFADGLPIKQLLFKPLEPFICGISRAKVVTFRDRVARAEWIMNCWLMENNQPEQSTKERRKRLNREAQQRFKHRKEAEGKSDSEMTPKQKHAIAVKAAYDEFRRICTERRAATNHWNEQVANAQKAWDDLKAQEPKE